MKKLISFALIALIAVFAFVSVDASPPANTKTVSKTTFEKQIFGEKQTAPVVNVQTDEIAFAQSSNISGAAIQINSARLVNEVQSAVTTNLVRHIPPSKRYGQRALTNYRLFSIYDFGNNKAREKI